MGSELAQEHRDIAIIGAGSYAATIAELASTCGYVTTQYLDDDCAKNGSRLDGAPIHSPIAAGLADLPSDCSVAVAIGNNDVRLFWLERARALGLDTPSLISPMSLVSPKASIGEAVYLHPGCQVWTHATLGNGTILSPHATVAHHTQLGEGCFVSTGANVGASITVDAGCMFGIGSVVSTGVSHVSSHTLVGAGATVIRNTEPYGVYVGNPARLIRTQTS